MAKKKTDGKQASLQETLDALNKKYSSIGEQERFFISTGSIALDKALGGGFISGRITELIAWEATGKTTLALHAVANCQKQGLRALYIDAEHALDKKYSRNLGVNWDDMILIQPSFGEEAFDSAEELIKTGEIDVLIFDSTSGMIPKSQFESDAGNSHIGKHAILFNKEMPKLNTLVSKYNVVCIFISQVREKIGAMFGCLHGDTQVLFTDGRSIPIKKVVEDKIEGKVWSINQKTNLFEEKEIIDWHFNGKVENPTDFIHFETQGLEGQNTISFTVTPNHKVLTDSGWKEAKDINLHDKIISKYTSVFSGTLKDFLCGTLCGDSHISTRDKTTACLKLQDKSNPEYLKWKVEKLSKFIEFKEFNGKYVSEFNSEWNIIKNKYPNRDPQIFLDNETNLSLALWFMDDAHFDEKDSHCRYKLSLKRFKTNPKKLESVVNFFNSKLDFNCSFDKAGTIIFNKKDSLNIAKRICKYVPSCMQYKLPLEFRNKYEEFSLETSIDDLPKGVGIKNISYASNRKMRTKGKYDISIKDNKNYLVGGSKNGIIVHNSPETTQAGNALKFFAGSRIELRKQLIKDGDVVIGTNTKFKVIKCKNESPYSTGVLPIRFGIGIDKYEEIITLAKDLDIIKVWGKTITLFGAGEEEDVKYDETEFMTLLKDNDEFFESLKATILEKYTPAIEAD